MEEEKRNSFGLTDREMRRVLNDSPVSAKEDMAYDILHGIPGERKKDAEPD